jgi:transposase
MRCTVRKNKLTAICDEIFPEFTEIFADPNGESALAIRIEFPTPIEISHAHIEELAACCVRSSRHNPKTLHRLQQLAVHTIGAKDEARVSGLRLEQTQLIEELRLLQTHVNHVEAEILTAIKNSREGQILTSIPTICPLQAATLMAHIGSIGNFERVPKLRAYCGWSPRETQTGTTIDVAYLDRGGNKTLKHSIYLMVWSLISHDTEFKAIYDRLVPLKCRYDERLGRYRGKNKVIGRIAGQFIGVVYSLLRCDYVLLSGLGPDDAIPEPVLYSRERHRAHRLLLRVDVTNVRRPS